MAKPLKQKLFAGRWKIHLGLKLDTASGQTHATGSIKV